MPPNIVMFVADQLRRDALTCDQTFRRHAQA